MLVVRTERGFACLLFGFSSRFWSGLFANTPTVIFIIVLQRIAVWCFHLVVSKSDAHSFVIRYYFIFKVIFPTYLTLAFTLIVLFNVNVCNVNTLPFIIDSNNLNDEKCQNFQLLNNKRLSGTFFFIMVISSGTGTHWRLSCLQQPPQRSTNAQVGSQLTFGSFGISTGICNRFIA